MLETRTRESNKKTSITRPDIFEMLCIRARWFRSCCFVYKTFLANHIFVYTRCFPCQGCSLMFVGHPIAWSESCVFLLMWRTGGLSATSVGNCFHKGVSMLLNSNVSLVTQCYTRPRNLRIPNFWKFQRVQESWAVPCSFSTQRS